VQENNNEDKTKIRTRLLSNRGIKKHYHYKSLTEYNTKYSKKMLDIVTNYGPEDAEIGLGITIVGTSTEAYDLTILACRSLNLRRLDTYFFQFSDIVNQENQLFAALHDKDFPALCIANFNPNSFKTDIKEYSLLESFLQHNYLDDNKPLIIHFPVEPVSNNNYLNYGDLISENFLGQIMKKNKLLEVHNVNSR
jgi:hypothetical protein